MISRGYSPASFFYSFFWLANQNFCLQLIDLKKCNREGALNIIF